MDRCKTGVTKSQSGFFNIVALPMYAAMAQAFPAITPVLDAVRDNLAMWAAEEAQRAQEAEARAKEEAQRAQESMAQEEVTSHDT